MQVWRLIVDDPGTGAWNMALDEALWWSAVVDGARPALRLYQWSMPTVSLGRFQNAAGVEHGERLRRGIDLVRRPTGGRAVLHDRELTYSVTAPERALGASGVLATYCRIQSALRRGLRALGIKGELVTGAERGRVSHPSCFVAATQADGMIHGGKLIGSAQARRRGVLLQHGSILIDHDTALWQALFGPGSRAVTLADLLGGPPDLAVVRCAIIEGFGEELGVTLCPTSYSSEELAAARSLAVTKYARLGARGTCARPA